MSGTAAAPREATGRVVMYCTSFCPYCVLARRLLAQRGIPYEEHRLSRGADGRARLADLSGGGRTYPQILIDGRRVGGYAELRRLEREGGLERLTGSAAVDGESPEIRG